MGKRDRKVTKRKGRSQEAAGANPFRAASEAQAKRREAEVETLRRQAKEGDAVPKRARRELKVAPAIDGVDWAAPSGTIRSDDELSVGSGSGDEDELDLVVATGMAGRMPSLTGRGQGGLDLAGLVEDSDDEDEPILDGLDADGDSEADDESGESSDEELAAAAGGDEDDSESEEEAEEAEEEEAEEAEEVVDEDDDDEEEEEEEEAEEEEEGEAEAAAAGAGTKRRRRPASQPAAPAVELAKDKAVGNKSGVLSFSELGISRPLLRAMAEMGWNEPTEIQAQAIPHGMQGRDLLGSAVTGSGKTGAFLLPALERLLYRNKKDNAVRVLVVLPTREVAAQCYDVARKLCRHTDIRIALVVGGSGLKVQEAELRSRPDVAICTPGRMIDLLANSPAVDVDAVDVLVLDEADRLLDMGFQEEVEELIKYTPKGRQTMLFSATMNDQVGQLASLSLDKPVTVAADPVYDLADRLLQEFVRVRAGKEGDKEAICLAVVERALDKRQTIVFCQTKRSAKRLAAVLRLTGVEAVELHGDMPQTERILALEQFRTRQSRVLVATDLAGRGLDIKGVTAVVNFDMPRDLTTYVHRVGRTARAGASGIAISLVTEGVSRNLMREVVKRAKINVRARRIPKEVVTANSKRIRKLGKKIDEYFEEQRAQRELRKADMEVNRAINIQKHQDEILARPARTWFQSGKEKKQAKERAKQASETSAPVPAAAAGAAAVEPELAAQIAKGNPNATRADPFAGLSAKERKKLIWKAEQRLKDKAKAKKPHSMTRRKRRRLEIEERIEKEAKDARRTIKQEEEVGGGGEEAAGGRRKGRGRRDQEPAEGGRDEERLADAKRKLKRADRVLKTSGMSASRSKLDNKRRRAAERGEAVPMTPQERAKERKQAKQKKKSAADANPFSADFGAAGFEAPAAAAASGADDLVRRDRRREQREAKSAASAKAAKNRASKRGGKGAAKFKSKARHKRR